MNVTINWITLFMMCMVIGTSSFFGGMFVMQKDTDKTIEDLRRKVMRKNASEGEKRTLQFTIERLEHRCRDLETALKDTNDKLTKSEETCKKIRDDIHVKINLVYEAVALKFQTINKEHENAIEQINRLWQDRIDENNRMWNSKLNSI